MKEVRTLTNNWSLLQLDTHGRLDAERMQELCGESPAGDWIPVRQLGQVAEILLAEGRIEDPRFDPDGPSKCQWIAESDWVYRCVFKISPQGPDSRSEIGIPNLGNEFPNLGKIARLIFQGLDTLADVYLNGKHMAFHDDIYLPLDLDVTEVLKERNILLVHFYSPHAWLSRQSLDPEWEGMVHKNRLLRKPHEDFNSFNGAFPYFTPIGIYEVVNLVVPDEAEIADFGVDAEIMDGKGTIDIEVYLNDPGYLIPDSGSAVSVSVYDPDGRMVAECRAEADADTARYTATLTLDGPRLWWPRGYGEQPLYRVACRLTKDGRDLDVAEKHVGFRDVQCDERFHLRVNGTPIKMWGACFAPLEQFTHTWPEERIPRLLDLAENAHMVVLRAWGPGAPFGDNLYDEADRRGILLWSELYHTWGMFPDHEDFYDRCRREAEHHVRKYKHHPSVFMWCGANEVHMGSGIMYPDKPVLSRDLYHDIYPEVCRRLDPKRYYHIDSPYGGDFPNDPLAGDSHGYTHHWYVRGVKYPVLLTENARWSPPQIRTLRRYISDPGKLWPGGFVSRVTHRRPNADSTMSQDAALKKTDIYEEGFLPPAWQRLGKGGHILDGRAGPIGDFYDTGDTPEGLIYRMGSAHSEFLRRDIERFRRGRPAHEADRPRRVMGHLWWRLNGTWPLIDSELIDYLLEPKMAYYAVRRAYAPVLLSFDIGNHITLWLTNDSGESVRGTVTFRMVDGSNGAILSEKSCSAEAAHDESKIVMNLDDQGMFQRKHALYAELAGKDGRIITRTNDFAYEERNIIFPDARLSLKAVENDAVAVSTDVFARCVELTAMTTEGDEFGWDFEDNFFDLMPGEERAIRRLGPHKKGTITAKAWFSSESVELSL